MSVPLKLFKKTILISIVLLISLGCSSKEKRLLPENLQTPEELKEFVVNGISDENKKLSQYPYSGAILNKKQNDWAAAAKGFAEASLLHPTAKSLIGLSESEAKFYTKERFGEETAILTLTMISKYLKGAIAVDSIQKEMSSTETEELNNDIVCVDEFLKNKIKTNNCKYVIYIFQPQE